MAYVPFSPQEYCGIIAGWLQQNPQAWCQGAMARDADGYGKDASDPNSRAYCTMGLLEKFIPDMTMRDRCAKLLSRVLTPFREGVIARSNRSPVSYNDTSGRSVEEIISMFRCASYMPDVPECEPGEMLHEHKMHSYEEALKDYTQKLKEEMEQIVTVKVVKAPNWQLLSAPEPLIIGDEVTSMAAQLGLPTPRLWCEVVQEMKDAMAA